MYIIKNAIRNITRSLGRSLLLGIILFVLVLCSALGLSIQQAAKTSQEASLDLTNISATIQRNMNDMFNGFEPGNKEDMRQEMQNIQDLSLDQLESYADLSVVSGFTYSASLQASSSSLEPISTNGPQFGIGAEQESDFRLVGYSSDLAMSDFLEGNATISEGQMFSEGTTSNECILPNALATYNGIEVGDTISLEISDATYDFVVTGLYESNSISQPGQNQNASSNQILTSANAVLNISSSAQIQGTYTFANVEDYETFCDSIDLDDDYTVVSMDLQEFEQSQIPLQNLSTFSKYFLAIVLGIGAIVLIAINIFSVRERKQEIGILCAIGMKKGKIALQFFVENLCIASIALVLATGIVAFTSVPLTNTLLQTQMESNQSRDTMRAQNFERQPNDLPSDSNQPPNDDKMTQPSLQVSKVNEAMNMQAFIQLIFIFFLLLFISCMAGFVSLIRYDPNQILTHRD